MVLYIDVQSAQRSNAPLPAITTRTTSERREQLDDVLADAGDAGSRGGGDAWLGHVEAPRPRIGDFGERVLCRERARDGACKYEDSRGRWGRKSRCSDSVRTCT